MPDFTSVFAYLKTFPLIANHWFIGSVYLLSELVCFWLIVRKSKPLILSGICLVIFLFLFVLAGKNGFFAFAGVSAILLIVVFVNTIVYDLKRASKRKTDVSTTSTKKPFKKKMLLYSIVLGCVFILLRYIFYSVPMKGLDVFLFHDNQWYILLADAMAASFSLFLFRMKELRMQQPVLLLVFISLLEAFLFANAREYVAVVAAVAEIMFSVFYLHKQEKEKTNA